MKPVSQRLHYRLEDSDRPQKGGKNTKMCFVPKKLHCGEGGVMKSENSGGGGELVLSVRGQRAQV